LRQEIVDRPDAQGQVAPERNVHASPKRHREGIVGSGDSELVAAMGDAEKLVGKRRKAAVVMEIELRAEHEGEQIRADVYAADLPNVITAESTGDPIPLKAKEAEPPLAWKSGKPVVAGLART